MSLLDGNLGPSTILDRMTFKGLLAACGITFLVSTIALPLIAFGTFTARDENGWINGFIMLMGTIWVFSGLLTAVLVVVAWIQRKDIQDDVPLSGFSGDTTHLPPPQPN